MRQGFFRFWGIFLSVYLEDRKSFYIFAEQLLTNIFLRMKSIHHYLILLLLAMLCVPAMGQEFYDITENYLKNASFDDHFDYDINATGNVEQELLPVAEWTADHTADYTITGVYQLGTKKTFNGVKVPATGVDGETTGGVLALSTGWDQSLRFKQSIQLPKGTYKLVVNYYNCDASKTAGTSLVGWVPTSGAVMSSVKSFPAGKWITDTLSFKLSLTKKGAIQLGFLAASGGSANSAKICIDYVKLLRDTPFGDADITLYKVKLQVLIETVEKQYGDGTARGANLLKEPLDHAKAVYANSQSTLLEIDEACEMLNAALAEFRDLQTVVKSLGTWIDRAEKAVAETEGEAAEALKQAIQTAKTLYDDNDATAAQLSAAESALEEAYEVYCYSNPTGNIPTVVTAARFARGATMAFGRLSVTNNGATIKERGFCFSEAPEPTINDNRTTKLLTGSSVSGDIYWLQDLKPATKYYMRAYAITNGYQVAYGKTIKFYTIPKGTISLQMRDGGDKATYDRIKQASEDAVDYWNNLTEMKGFSPSVGFVDGTPTADCSYGGWIRVGSNTSYQRTGTILHEMLHGIGVIPWADTEWSRHTLRSGVNGDGYGTGQWLGDRVTDVVRFLQNDNTSVLNGDYQHMWPYGINGASEDNGQQALYIGNGLVCQALGEDGLQHTYSLFAEPYYALDQEDDIKYYIKNESADCGLYTSFLVPADNGTLRWRELTAEQAAQNDSVAWCVTFTPGNQYYQFRNAATNQYMTYTGSTIKTASHANPTSSDNWHLMTGRVDVGGQRGYWIISPEANWTPHCLQANVNGTTTAATFDIANSAERQRWLIMSLEQVESTEQAAMAQIKGEVASVLQQVKSLLDVPHTEDVAGTDQALSTAVADIEARMETAANPVALSALSDEAQQAALAFLQNVTATDGENPFNLTYMIQNPTLDVNTDGWSESRGVSYGCVEFYQTAFDFNQTLRNLPAGNYQLRAQGFQRPGSADAAYNTYIKGNNTVNAYIYAGTKKEKLQHIAADAQTKKLGGSEKTVGTNYYIPDNMQAASLYFAKGLYQNSVNGNVATDGGTLKVGIRCSDMPSSYWVIFDNFRLFFYGDADPATLGVKDIIAARASLRESLYMPDGRPANARQKGLVIVRKSDGTVQKQIVR